MTTEIISALILAVVAYLVWKVFALARKERGRRIARATAEAESLPAYKAAYLHLDIVGESYRQHVIRQLWDDGAGRTFTAIMIPESDNPHDRNAVRVEVEGLHVGYLSRETAKDYRGYMNDQRCAVPVHLVRGGPEGTIGVFTGRKH
jgi:hypothetical protein